MTNRWFAILGLTALLVSRQNHAAEVHVATQYGFGFLPMMVTEHEHLFDQRLAEAGLKDTTVRWSTLGTGSAANDALLSGSVDITSGGVAPFIVLWAKTKGSVRAISALNSLPLTFNTRDPNVHQLEDLTDKDRIALTAPKISVHAILLQIAASKRWGMRDYAHYDSWTVSMSQPDGMAALLSGGVSNHFTAPPYGYAEAQHAGIRTIATGEQILGGPATFIATWTTAKFRTANPLVYQAFLSATSDAIDTINKNPKSAAEIYLEMSRDKMSQAEVLALLSDPATHFTTTPQNVMTFARFMFDVGTIKTKPDTWKDMFFPEIHELPGS